MADKIPVRAEFSGPNIVGLAEFQTGAPNETVGIDFGGTSADTAPQALINLIGTPTKGRIVVADGFNWVVLPVGVNGDVLTADSAQVTGVKWFPASGSADLFATIVTDTGGPVVADSPTDTLTLVGGTGITTAGVAGTDTITISPANDLAAVEALATTGLAVRTGVETWTTRSIVASTTAGLEGANLVFGNGVGGNPEVGVNITGQVASAGDMIATDEFLGFDGANNVKFTGQQIADGVSSLLGGVGNAYTTITGDVGSATAASSTDTLNFTGVGITTTAANGAPDSVTLTLSIADLAAGVGPLVVGDEIAVNDGGSTLRFTFTDVVQDLNIVYGITTDGIIVRTADDTYTSRTLVAPAAGITITNPAGIAGNPTFVLANDLAALEGLAGTGIAVRSAADTWVQRSIVASVDEDNLGASVVDGSGVAGNPTIGVTIVTLTDPGADMAAADEFIVHDKSEGTAGANRKITGQNIADGVFVIAGFTGFTMSTINGQLVPTFTDTTRGNKQLSFAESVFSFSDNVIGNNDWFDIGNATDATTGHVVPLTGTIVRASIQCADDNGNTKGLDLYINGVLNSTLFTTTGSSAAQTNFNAALNIDVAQGDRLQLRGDAAGGSIDDTVVDVWVKWRA